MEQPDRIAAAERLFKQAYQEQMNGNLDRAVELYQASIAIVPTAEAHTFLGWTYSFQGKIDDAISECQRAIAVDPDFGNPYNDIGVYLLTKGNLDEAIPWLLKAKGARRYEPRHFPCLNLGRIYLAKGLMNRARVEFEEALRFEPTDNLAKQALEEIELKLN